MYYFYGCDDFYGEQECAASMNTTEGGMTRAIYGWEWYEDTGISVTAGLTATVSATFLTWIRSKDDDRLPPNSFLVWVLNGCFRFFTYALRDARFDA